MTDGKGPPASDDFHRALEALYGIAYGLKFGRKRSGRGRPFKVAALEGRWAAEGWTDASTLPPSEQWTWRLRISVPPDATQDEVAAIVRREISTVSGSLKAFAPTHLAAGPAIAGPEYGSPMGIGLTVVFSGSYTGWRLSPDGLSITSLTADEVKEALTHVRSDIYCALDGTKHDATPVPYLDAVPPSVVCYPWQTGSGATPPPPTVQP